MNFTDTDLYLLYKINEQIKENIKEDESLFAESVPLKKEEFIKTIIEKTYKIIYNTIQSETKTLNQEKGYKAGLEEGYKNGYKDGFSKGYDEGYNGCIRDDYAL